MTKLQTLAADLSAHARNMILGDFNLAPRESGGPRREPHFSTFTCACEPSAFAKLNARTGSRFDATESGEAVFHVQSGLSLA